MSVVSRIRVASLIVCLFVAAVPCLLGAEGEPVTIQGPQGAIPIRFTMPVDGKASVGLYTPKGRLVRILGQVLELDKGQYEILWDGMDLWGSMVPAGTKLECRVITHKGVRAFYEFAAGRGDWDKESPAWLTRPEGEGLDARTGGWLGDHTGPAAAAAVGNRIFFGCSTAEHGHSMMATDLEGHKIWGGSPGGWGGPTELFADGDQAVLGRMKNSVFRVEAESYRKTHLFNTGRDPIRCMTVHGGMVHLMLFNHKITASPIRKSVPGIDWQQAVPVTLGTRAPEFQISARSAFGSVFKGGAGHFQVGLQAKSLKGDGHVIVPFTEAREVGTFAVQSIKGVEKIEIYMLDDGIKYDQGKHSPLPDQGKTNSLDELMDGGENDIELGLEFSGHWKKVGESKLPDRVNYITLKKAGQKTTALYFKLVLPRKNAPNRVGFSMCRVFTKPFQPVKAQPKVMLPDGADGQVSTDGRVGWKFRTAEPVSPIGPADVILDYGKPVEFDAIAFLNHVNPDYTVYLLEQDVDPFSADESKWIETRKHKAWHNKKMGCIDSRDKNHDTYFHFYQTRKARAIKLHYTGGYHRAKIHLGWTKDDPQKFRCDDIRLLKQSTEREMPAAYVYQVRDAKTGKIVSEKEYDDLEISRLAFGPDGTMFTVHANRLCKSVPGEKQWRHTPISDMKFTRVSALGVYGDKIVLADRCEDSVVHIFGTDGKLLNTIGKGQYEPGPWDRDKLNKPVSATIDANGKLWVTENGYAPKRIARFNLNGKCEKEFIGQPEYGGGGYIDPNLKSFYYRGLEHELDWDKGLSRLKAMNDKVYHQQSPTFDRSSFSYTRGGRVVYHNGRKYALGEPGGGVWIALMDEKNMVWKPAVIMGPANSMPLKRKEWSEHFLKINLVGKFFIWRDENGDGKYQIPEVTLYDYEKIGFNPISGGSWGPSMGKDLTIWTGSGRWVPSSIDENGVPKYELDKFQRFNYYAEDFPKFYGLETYGARAKPSVGNCRIVSPSGKLVLEGQPYRILPDLTWMGGKPKPEPQGYKPRIHGQLIHQPLGYAGCEATDGEVKEVAVTIGNNGRWSIVSVDDVMMLDSIFTGRRGGWSSVPEQRGVEVTDYKHPNETFFGHFVRARDGRFFVSVGKGTHSICRVEGLNDFKITRVPVEVTDEAYAKNSKLHDVLVKEWKDWKRAMSHELANRTKTVYSVKDAERFKMNVRVDGSLGEWGNKRQMQPIDEAFTMDAPAEKLHFDAAYDDEGLYLAYRGLCFTGSSVEDPKFLFKKGFAFDFRYRLSGGKGKDVQPGDRRIVFGKHDGKWIAVMYDYESEKIEKKDYVEFRSPVVTTKIAEVKVIPDSKLDLKVDMGVLGLDIEDAGKSYKKVKPIKGEQWWTAEVFIPWSTLGFQGKPGSFRGDVGVIGADSGGIQAGMRKYWSNPLAERAVNDLGIEAQIKPGTWGIFNLGKKR
ncbi:MAG: hypothetical protein ACLFVU_10005 [Phycisphaerae bacterium]